MVLATASAASSSAASCIARHSCGGVSQAPWGSRGGPDIGRHWERPTLNRASAPSCRFWCYVFALRWGSLRSPLGRTALRALGDRLASRDQRERKEQYGPDVCAGGPDQTTGAPSSVPQYGARKRGAPARSPRLINTPHAPSGPKRPPPFVAPGPSWRARNGRRQVAVHAAPAAAASVFQPHFACCPAS